MMEYPDFVVKGRFKIGSRLPTLACADCANSKEKEGHAFNIMSDMFCEFSEVKQESSDIVFQLATRKVFVESS